MYVIFATDTFKEIYSSLDKTEKDWIDTIKKKLEEIPTGRPLGYRWFLEKKFLNKRLFFLVDEERKKLLFVSFASKKEEQAIIDFVKDNMKELLEHPHNL
ncbi:MAG TPA: hypothetical protein VJH22_00155 [Candidatus Nanoarchaeia archaeon]|nr:hypothetical protein [Candidatus Nanoarchaeia archaeon]